MPTPKTPWLNKNLQQAAKNNKRISKLLQEITNSVKFKKKPMTKTKSAKIALVNKISKQLPAFDILGRVGGRKVSKTQMLALLKRKKYRLLKKEGNSLVFVRKTWSDRSKALLSPKTNDFSVVILQKEIGSEGLVHTCPKDGGMYDGGNIKSFNELYSTISKFR